MEIIIYPLIYLAVQMLRHKTLEIFADASDPIGKKLIYLFIRHIKQRNKFCELFFCEIRDIKIKIAIGECE